jgi:hypothetical protein
MTDPFTAVVTSAVAKPAVELLTNGAIVGWRRIRRYFSPTILIAGQHNAGKTTLSEYFRTGKFPPKESPMDETQDFESRLVELILQRPGVQQTATFWIRDSRGFFDANPLVKDVQYVHPVFMYFVFDIKKIEVKKATVQTMKLEFVDQWMEKFKERVQEHISVNSKTKRALCGAAVLINKCDAVDNATFVSKQAAFDQRIRHHFRDLQPLLGFGDQRFDVFYTSMIAGKKLPRSANPESDFPLAIDFMVRMLSNGGVI